MRIDRYASVCQTARFSASAIPSHTQDRSPRLAELISACRSLSAGRVNEQVNYPSNSVWRKHHLSQEWFVRPALLLSCVIFSTYHSSQLVINQSIKKCQKKASIICEAGDLMAWTNEGRCCKITQLLLVSRQ